MQVGGQYMKILILGAGPCGLGAALHLHKLGHTDWQLFERNDYVGGLSASFVDDAGFIWDVGGHVLFSHYAYFDRAVEDALGDAYLEHLRESWVHILGTWVPYPFQNNIRHLPIEVLDECLDGLRSLAGDPQRALNFREWMDTVFGKGIVKYFMEPYNHKVWGVPLETMSREWIGERVSVVDLARIERNIAEGLDDVNWGPNNRFKFPLHGGTGQIYERIADRFRNRIHLGHECVSVDPVHKTVRFSNGVETSYDILINTTPLDRFIGQCSRMPEEIVNATGSLVHNGGYIVGLGFAGTRIDPKCWMYFPEANSPFYRVTNFHNYSPNNVPGGRLDEFFSLMCETTYSPYKPVDKDVIVEETLQGLVNSGLLSDDEQASVVSRYLIDIPYSYPVPTVDRDAALKVIQPYLESLGIYSRGRFGAWKYEVGNMDHSFMQGVDVVDRILTGKDEITIGMR